MNNVTTIRDLATAFSSQDHLEYKKILDNSGISFSSRDHLEYKKVLDNSGISKDARKFLFRKIHEIRFVEDCAEFRKNQLNILKSELDKHQFASNESAAFCEKVYNELNEANKVLAQKRRNLRLAQQEVKKAEEEVSELNGLYTHWQQISAKENSSKYWMLFAWGGVFTSARGGAPVRTQKRSSPAGTGRPLSGRRRLHIPDEP